MGLILYHGSNLEVREPSLLYSRSSLDFGKGFYTTTDPVQAEKWAGRVVHMRKTGQTTISVYETDEDLWNRLRVLHFEKADREWLRMVVRYRTQQPVDEVYDVIGGPVANDRTVDVINQFIAGSFPERIALELLLPMKLRDQWTIKTEKALAAIRWKETITV